jgi:hypothetical protein
MHLAGRPTRFILLMLLALTASGIMFYLADGDLASGNMHNAVRNWEQYGLLTLQGKMVVNPGGYEALTNPQVYKGHRAASLYPVFFIKRLFGWTGAGSLAVHVTLSLIVLLSIWVLLGRNRIGWLVGAAAILCPGYIRDQTYLDPNVLALVMGLPFAAIVLPLLVRPSLSPISIVVLFLTIAVYTSLNWTTAFVHGVLLAYLVVARQVTARRVWLYIAASGLSVILVTGISVLDKQKTCASFEEFLGAYLWGKVGYGAYLTTDRALIRLLFVVVAGLLPLLLVHGYLFVQRLDRNSEKPWAAFLPLAAVVLGVGVMRNYFGTVPWMAAAAFLAALVLSIKLILEGRSAAAAASEPPSVGRALPQAAFLTACFCYALAVSVLATLHDSECRAMVTLVRVHTARSDTIVVAETDPKLASICGGVADVTDRRIVVQRELSLGEPLAGRTFLLSTSGEVKLPLVATTSQPALISWPVVQRLLAWYRMAVARRLPGDQGFRPGTCYLYELVSATRAANLQASPTKPARPM